MKMDERKIFFLLPLLLALLSPCQAAVREKRQYSRDEFDPVNGASIADCVFYGDQTVDCTGRLRCHPSDVPDRATSATLDRVCPREPSQKTGTWDRDQVIPAAMMRNTGSGRVAKCQFNANHQSGQFTCTSVQGDTWKGKYTGTINTAFKLGLPVYPAGSVAASASGAYPDDSVYGSGTAAGSRYPADSVYDTAGRDRYNVGRDNDYYTTTSLYSSYGSVPAYGSRDLDNYGAGRYSTGLGLNDRDSSYRDRDSTAVSQGDRYQPNYRPTDSSYNRDGESPNYPVGASTSQVTICIYHNDGTGKCGECSESVDHRQSGGVSRTTKRYTCSSGLEIRTSWSANSGFVPAGQRPDVYASNKRIISTCILRPDQRNFECHGGSSDGGCRLSSAPAGSTYASSGVNSLSDCLTGNKWTGTYRGSIY